RAIRGCLRFPLGTAPVRFSSTDSRAGATVMLLGAMPAPSAEKRVKTILLIEDDPALLRLEQTILRDAGYTADAAADGDQAPTKLQAPPYHGIVLALTVPGGDGSSRAEQISGLDANRHTPLIIVGSDEPRGRQRAFDAGAMAYLPKPVTAEAFRTVLHSVISPAERRAPATARAVPPCRP